MFLRAVSTIVSAYVAGQNEIQVKMSKDLAG